MIRLLLPLVLIALGPVPALTQTPSERGAGRIHIDAVAVDKNGLPVMDLKPAEVEVWIGHFRVPIESFTVVTPDANPSGQPRARVRRTQSSAIGPGDAATVQPSRNPASSALATGDPHDRTG